MKSESQFTKRLKSLMWRGCMMSVAFFVSFLIDNLSSLQLSPTVTMFSGLALGEISKWLNTKTV